MKTRLLALALALMMLLGAAPAFAQVPAEDPVLATLNGEPVLKSEVDDLIPLFVENQYIADATDYRTVLNAVIQRRVLMKKTKELGFDQFSDEEVSAFKQEAQSQWDAALADYADQIQSDASEQARQDALKAAEEFFHAQKLSLESLETAILENAATDRMTRYLVGDYTPDDAEIQAVFEQYGPMYEQNYANDIPQYEYMTRYYGQSSWYTPEGYRGIVHILLKPDEELLKAYSQLVAAFEEQQQAGAQPAEGETAEPAAASAETPEPVTQEMVDAARQAVIDSRKADVDAIYERLGKGESFIDLIREYGEDPGMTDPATLAEGYPVHADSVVYDPVFTSAAFAEKLAAPGDVGDPVVGSFGIHILQYLRDVPSGLVMTDAIRQEIMDYLSSVKKGTAYEQAVADWMTKEAVVYNQEAIDQAIAQAQQAAQSPEEEPLEAVPGRRKRHRKRKPATDA